MDKILIGEILDCWTWEEWQVQEALEMWREGYSVIEISDRLKVHEFSAAILVLDLIRTRRTIMRPGGLLIENRKEIKKHD